MDKTNIEQRVSTMISLVKEKIVKIKKPINNFRFMEAGYKKGNDVPLFSGINSVSFISGIILSPGLRRPALRIWG